MPELRVGFAGSPEFAARILTRLAASSVNLCAVFTQPDRPKGRGRRLQANPVKQLAEHLTLPVHQPKSLKNKAARAQMAAYNLDVLVVAAYGLILPPRILQLPKFGCLNVHASVLPRWRGAAPIERAVMAGDTSTGVCIMQMEEGLDTGPVFAREVVPIEPPVDIVALEQTLADRGADLLVDVLERLARKGRLPNAVPQDDAQATYAPKLTAADRVIDWQCSAATISRRVQALAARLPVRTQINDCGVQLLAAQEREQSLVADDRPPPGTIVDVSKQGINVQCVTNLLHITSLKVERGKGGVLDAAAAINGFSDLFYSGARLR